MRSVPKRVLPPLVSLLVFAWGPLPVLAHQTPPAPPESELARTQPALRGSDEFLRVAPDRLRERCNDEQLQLLDDIRQYLGYREKLRWRPDAPAVQRASEYFRWRCESAMLELLRGFRDVIDIDLVTVTARNTGIDPIDLDLQHSSVILHVVTGKQGPVELDIQTWDLSKEETLRGREIVVGDRGETFVLMQIEGSPAAETIHRFPIRLRSDDEPCNWRAIRWKARPWGQLVIDITDEKGEPTPALLSLRSKRGGLLWTPEGCLDFRPQLDNILAPPFFDPGKGYMFYLPGHRRGRYWIVPSHLEMAIPEGPWEVKILRGAEHKMIVEEVEVVADNWTRKSYQTERWTEMSKRGWWSGDDHVHARLLSGADGQRLLEYCKAVDLYLANILEMGDPLRTYYSQRGFGPEFRVQNGNRWLVPGQEDPRSELGHAIGLNLRTLVRDLDRYLLNDTLAHDIHEQGGLYGHTHVGANACFAHREMALFTPMDIVDFNSIMQADLGTELYYNFLNLGFKMTASAGSDTPYAGAIGNVRVYAYTGDTHTLDPDDWFAALKAGRTFVSNGPMLEFHVDDSVPGETIALQQSQPLRVRGKAWGNPGGSAPKELRVVKLGDAAEIVRSEDIDQGELAVDVRLDSGHGCWIALHAIGHDGSQAHTTPVYISVGGKRHWAVDKAEALIDLQLSVLDEIESALQSSEELVAKKVNLLDFWNIANSQQADQVRERIASSRAFYLDLKRQLPNKNAVAVDAANAGAAR